MSIKAFSDACRNLTSSERSLLMGLVEEDLLAIKDRAEETRLIAKRYLSGLQACKNKDLSNKERGQMYSILALGELKTSLSERKISLDQKIVDLEKRLDRIIQSLN